MHAVPKSAMLGTSSFINTTNMASHPVPGFFDSHLHLSGSVSREYLLATATHNKVLPIYHRFIELNDDHKQAAQTIEQSGYGKETIDLLWQQFDCIHQIMKTPEDIRLAVHDVVKNSTAQRLEIRTTAKKLGDASIEDTIEAFNCGLAQASQKYPDKQVKGLLSIDRTSFTLEQAKATIDHASKLKQKDGNIVGIDISGNPYTDRTLYKQDLITALEYALTNNLAIAIHLGEADNEEEEIDTTMVLEFLKHWHDTNKAGDTNPLHGRVRLGHVIHLSDEAREIIQKLRIPIEVCPSCHRLINWHRAETLHHATQIYQNPNKDPILFGTDDKTLFHCQLETEVQTGFSFFSKEPPQRKKLIAHQRAFEFN